MKRCMSITINRDYKINALILSQNHEKIEIEHFFEIEEDSKGTSLSALTKWIKKVDCVIVGCYFSSIGIIDVNVPPVSHDECEGILQHQLASLMPIPVTDLAWQYRRLSENKVRVMGVQLKEWNECLSFLKKSRLNVDILTSPLISWNIGVKSGEVSLPDYENEFSFGDDISFQSTKKSVEWEESFVQLQKELSKIELKTQIDGTPNLQLALMCLQGASEFVSFHQHHLPSTILPRRNKWTKRVLFLTFLVFLVLVLGGVIRESRSSYLVREQLKKDIRQLLNQEQLLIKENKAAEQIAEKGENAIKKLGIHMNGIDLLSKIGMSLPDHAYLENFSLQPNDGLYEFTVRGIEEAQDLKSKLGDLKNFVVKECSTNKDRRGAYHRVKLLTDDK